jgi:hypothetical protein
MGRRREAAPREAALNELRSSEKALGDLIEKHDRMPANHPDLAELGRMIRRLAAEVTTLKIRSD